MFKYCESWRARDDEGIVEVKGIDIKTFLLNFCFAHIAASKHQIFQNFVPTPHNYGWGRHKNCKDPMYRS